MQNPTPSDAGHQFVCRRLVLRWATPDERWPTDADEADATRLATRIEPLLERSGLGEINGLELGAGQIDILVFGRPNEADVDRLYELLAPAFRAADCPPGSCLVRAYRNPDRELESDRVP